MFSELEGPNFYERLDRVYQIGQAFVAQALPIHFKNPEGERFIDLVYEPVRDDAGYVTGIFVGGYDVMEQVRVAARLRESEPGLQQFNKTLESQVGECTNERDRMWNTRPSS